MVVQPMANSQIGDCRKPQVSQPPGMYLLLNSSFWHPAPQGKQQGHLCLSHGTAGKHEPKQVIFTRRSQSAGSTLPVPLGALTGTFSQGLGS